MSIALKASAAVAGLAISRFSMAIAVALALFGTTALAAAGAQASAVPVTKVYTNDEWHYPAVRPAWIPLGEGGSPGAHTWYWSSWGSSYARSHGTLWIDNCVPNCAYGHESYYSLYVTLTYPKYHYSTRYFSHMVWYAPGYWFRNGSHYSHYYVLNFYQSYATPYWH
jgi:hypothetical protein